ncbi:MAG: DUF4230 domain-containing protein [Leptolyngbyaceae cyanobacterium bins.349]|nr:DUF4230 domain-containing protein [Leptolyngbyaceae cyanobacterium bins.349]
MKDQDYRQERGSWAGGLLWMASGGAIAATLLFGFNNFQLSDRLFNTFNRLVMPQPSAPKVDVRSLVLQQVREASELTTAAFTMQAVVPTEQDATLGGFVVGKTKLLYIAHGEIKAGVDLSQITPQNVQVMGDRIQIQLPPPQILDKKIDVNHSQVYDYNRGMLGLGPDVGPELQVLAQQAALQKITAAACEEGILQKASDRAKLVVTQLLTTAGYPTVTVTAQPAAACMEQTGATVPDAKPSQPPTPEQMPTTLDPTPPSPNPLQNFPPE